ncbi:MAG: ATP-binding protein [Candidatus Stygibacter frigidus]|nr:ATP-binding protein [Candidatus Stygibacter frigidus]
MQIDINMELLRYQRLASLGRDLEGFVHNTAGPLNIIMGYGQILQNKYPDETGFAKMWAAVEEINGEMQELSSYLEKVQYEPFTDININKLILNKLELLRSNSEFKHNIESAVELEENLPLVRGSYGDIVICLDVLLNNAILAVQEEMVKKILVHTDVVVVNDRNYVRICVRDTGLGLKEELREKYFKLGYSDWSEDEESKGVGLSLAQYIIGRIGGMLTLENSDGIGAIGRIFIPLRENDEV